LNNPVEEEKEPDNDEEDEGKDSFKSDSDFREETDPEEAAADSLGQRSKIPQNHGSALKVKNVDDLVEDVASRLRPQN
jgi:hypothetical protein